MQPERNDNFAEEETGTGTASGCRWREVGLGGGFEAQMLRVTGNS
jgi:hypothetical protein